ncbi:MAG: hypothetical protein ABJD68_16840 [Nakamurella sp.]
MPDAEATNRGLNWYSPSATRITAPGFADASASRISCTVDTDVSPGDVIGGLPVVEGSGDPEPPLLAEFRVVDVRRGSVGFGGPADVLVQPASNTSTPPRSTSRQRIRGGCHEPADGGTAPGCNDGGG